MTYRVERKEEESKVLFEMNLKYEGNILKDQLCKAIREDKSNIRPAGLPA